VKFIVENIGDKKISFQTRRVYAVWSDGWTSPQIERYYNYNNGFWNGAHVPVGEQISFSVKYYVSEETEIDHFAYNVYGVYGVLFEDLCEY
ncbi:MAG: hypothetical protein K2J11_11140, partial [Oscillospiraceae bacterium]|nr:hypothetical protein [Oscillospiraceae bacterium]